MNDDVLDLEQPESTSDVSVDLVNDILSGVSDLLSDALSDGEDETSPPPVVIVNAAVSDDPSSDQEVSAPPAEEFLVYDEDYGVQVYAVNPITSASGLKGVLLDVLGDYDAIVVEYRYQTTTSGNYSYIREIQPDFPWLCSAGIFLALLWSVFSIGGRLICRK